MIRHSNVTELKFQQQCNIWYRNTRRDQIGRLFLIHNNPRNEVEGALLKGAGLLRGIADMIYLLPNGRYLFIEIKQGTTQSYFQIWFEEVVQKLGGYYVVVETLEEFQNAIIKFENLFPFNEKLPVYPIEKTKVESRS